MIESCCILLEVKYVINLVTFTKTPHGKNVQIKIPYDLDIDL